MPKKPTINAGLIRQLGGPKALSRKLTIDGKRPTPAAVSMWIVRNTIPYRWRPAVEALLRERAA